MISFLKHMPGGRHGTGRNPQSDWRKVVVTSVILVIAFAIVDGILSYVLLFERVETIDLSDKRVLSRDAVRAAAESAAQSDIDSAIVPASVVNDPAL